MSLPPSRNSTPIAPPLLCFSTLAERTDRKSTRLNSSHGYISYAVFCLNEKQNDADALSSLLQRHRIHTLAAPDFRGVVAHVEAARRQPSHIVVIPLRQVDRSQHHPLVR